mgnify:CR=1 FL=1
MPIEGRLPSIRAHFSSALAPLPPGSLLSLLYIHRSPLPTAAPASITCTAVICASAGQISRTARWIAAIGSPLGKSASNDAKETHWRLHSRSISWSVTIVTAVPVREQRFDDRQMGDDRRRLSVASDYSSIQISIDNAQALVFSASAGTASRCLPGVASSLRPTTRHAVFRIPELLEIGLQLADLVRRARGDLAIDADAVAGGDRNRRLLDQRAVGQSCTWPASGSPGAPAGPSYGCRSSSGPAPAWSSSGVAQRLAL